MRQEQFVQERAPTKASAHDGQRPDRNWHFQTAKESALTKESATTSLGPLQFGLKISNMQNFSSAVEFVCCAFDVVSCAVGPSGLDP